PEFAWAANKQLTKRSRTKKSLCNLNMVVDIFTLSLNGYIYNEGNMPDEIVITGGIYVKGHT
ncbi:hypothetical protein, partial [Anaerobutyricum hallii]